MLKEIAKLLERAPEEEALGLLLRKLSSMSSFRQFSDPAFDKDDWDQELLIATWKISRNGWVNKKGEPVENKEHFFFRMRTYILRNIWRKSSRRELLEEDSSSSSWSEHVRPEELAAPNSDPAISFEAKEAWELIWQYNPRNPKAKKAAWLHYAQGLSIGEVAKRMDANLNTVKSWLRLWHKGLERFLKFRL